MEPQGPSSYVRKIPVKVEPKVFFANERTFLAWLHMSLTLASISVGIVSYVYLFTYRIKRNRIAGLQEIVLALGYMDLF